MTMEASWNANNQDAMRGAAGVQKASQQAPSYNPEPQPSQAGQGQQQGLWGSQGHSSGLWGQQGGVGSPAGNSWGAPQQHPAPWGSQPVQRDPNQAQGSGGWNQPQQQAPRQNYPSQQGVWGQPQPGVFPQQGRGMMVRDHAPQGGPIPMGQGFAPGEQSPYGGPMVNFQHPDTSPHPPPGPATDGPSGDRAMPRPQTPNYYGLFQGNQGPSYIDPNQLQQLEKAGSPVGIQRDGINGRLGMWDPSKSYGQMAPFERNAYTAARNGLARMGQGQGIDPMSGKPMNIDANGNMSPLAQ
jgi:hypothetical protein